MSSGKVAAVLRLKKDGAEEFAVSVGMSKDGRRVALGGSSGKVRVWDVNEPPEEK
jgi:hypothetical protein